MDTSDPLQRTVVCDHQSNSGNDTTILRLASRSQTHTQNLCIMHKDVAIFDTLHAGHDSNSAINNKRWKIRQRRRGTTESFSPREMVHPRPGIPLFQKNAGVARKSFPLNLTTREI